LALAASNFSPAARAQLAIVSVGGLTAVAVDSVDGTIPAGGTGMTAGAYDTAMNRDTMLATVTELKASVNELITDLGTMGLPITAN
jgi:hypothetical protein